MPTEASVDWYPGGDPNIGDPNITPELLAKKLSIFTRRKFSEAEMLPYAHEALPVPHRLKLWR